MRYGTLPHDLGLININPVEMLFHMYMPISLPGNDRMYLPEHLKIFCPLIMAARADCPDRFRDEYVYLTAKTLWVSGDYIGNRPGWHSDGFGTDDLNYIWADRAPTDFLYSDEGFEFEGDNCDHFYTMCGIMEENTWLSADDIGRVWHIKQYADKHLLKLDPRMIHRSPVDFDEGMRSFAKVSISKDIYNLEGNASNYLLDTNWKMKPRSIERNHPSKRD